MRFNRSQKRKKDAKELKTHELGNGPSKLCQALSITKHECNEQDLSTWEKMWCEDDGFHVPNHSIVTTKRIGIDSYGPEWANKPLRFYIAGNKNVSVRDKNAEKSLNPG